MTDQRQIHLGVFATVGGHHVAGWRHPDSSWGRIGGFEFYRDIAQAAEKAKFDLFFLADTVSGVDPSLGGGIAHMSFSGHYDPLTLVPGLAALTERIGFVATATTTYNEPYHIARKFNSLDNQSGGRSGWNLVTSGLSVEAYNFGLDEHVAHGDRYERAEEFIEVVKGLWNSWEDDAFLVDRDTGLFFDLEKLHLLNHKGKHFSVRGPLGTERSPQGWPVIVQAGSSDPGIRLAARTAEVIFTAQQTLEAGQAFYRNVKGRLPAFGRRLDSVKIMPGILPIIGGTIAEAQAKLDTLQSLIHPEVALSLLRRTLDGVNLEGIDLNAPPPPDWSFGTLRSRVALLKEMADRDNLTVWQVAQRVAIARGHNVVVGTPETIADELQNWFENGAADGFNIMPPYFIEGFTDFTEAVVPELRRRGLFRSEYEGTTLRDHLGLEVPRHPAKQSILATEKTHAHAG